MSRKGYKIEVIVFFIAVILLSACDGGENGSSSTPISPTDIAAATTAPLQLGYSAENPVTANNQWMPVIQEFDGVEMVLVPAGCFMMGSTDEQINTAFAMCETGGGAVQEGVGGQCDRRWFTDEQPATIICFDEPFWIDRYEVTNGQFTLFSGQAVHDSHFSGDNRPRDQITWFEAHDFCALRGARLPTEAEWEFAARGPDNLTYPWGNDFVGDNVVYVENSNNQTAEVGPGIRSGGVSWVGAYDLSGNVWEWVSTLYRHYPYNATAESESDTTSWRALRGCSWDCGDFLLRAAERTRIEPDYSDEYGGFRCVVPFE